MAPRVGVPPAPPAGPAAPGHGETLWAGLLLLLLAGGVVPLLTRPTSGSEDTSALSILLQGLGCLIATIRLARSPGGLRRAVERLDPALLALLVLVVISIAWSVDPVLTLRRSGAVIAASLFGLYLAERWPIDEQVWLVLRVLTAAALASAVMALVLPSYGVTEEGPWRGVFLTKNVLARLMALGVLAAVLGAGTASWSSARRRQAVASGLLCGVVLVQAGSVFATLTVAAVLVLVAAALLVARTSYPLRQGVGVLLVAGVVTVLLVAWLERAAVLDLFGRDASLTGRLPIWSSVVPSIAERPWLGWGYGAFWQGWEHPSTSALLANPWGPPHSHNGLLETALNLGIVGAVLWLLALFACLRRGVQMAARGGGSPSLWAIALVLLLLAFNLTEVTAMSAAFFWTLFVSASAASTVRPAASAQLWTRSTPGRR